MPRTDDRRRAPRLILNQAVPAALSHTPVALQDVSTTGARVQHDNPIMYTVGKKFVLDIVCKGELFRMTCTVVRSRMETDPTSRRIVYTTGVKFVDADEVSIGRMCLAILAPTTAKVAAYEARAVSH